MNGTTFSFVPFVLYRTIFHPTERKIIGFSELENGWHYGEGIPIEHDAIEDAGALHRQIVKSGFYETGAFPGLDGEVQVTAYSGEHYFQFERSSDGQWTLIHEVNKKEVENIDHADLNQALEYARGLRSKICGASGSYPYGFTGIQNATNSMTSLSSRIKVMVEYPSLTKSVLFS